MPNDKELRAQLSNWIDAGVIADAIIRALEDEQVKADLEKAQAVWLDFLETELPDGLQSSTRALVEREAI